MNQNSFPLYLIPLLPLLGALVSLSIGRRLGKNIVSLIACGSVAGSMLLTWKAVALLGTAMPAGGHLADSFFTAPWIKAGDLTVSASLVLDNLSSVLCLVITGIGLLIHIYSTAYMEHEANYTRFFGYLNLFMGSMLILVLGDSLPVTFIGWEGVGLCSYLLIGFYFEKSDFAYAGRKAFVVNRIGDLGMLLAMFLIFARIGSLKYADMNSSAHADALHATLWFGMPAAYFIGLLVLVGAMGKSAQIPLYVWLPDAMAGPTPVSALIHAATMVTAGVYVIARMGPVFQLAPVTLAVVAWVGALTALYAATIGFAQRDLKKVLAYSTISQLGFMFVGVGSYVNQSSNYDAGVFHLVTHAFFKAGLFLAAGSVMHAMSGSGDIMKMGGLRKKVPHTHATFLIYCLAIAGIPPFAGFWSKDAILGGALAAKWPLGMEAGWLETKFANYSGPMLYGILLLAAACTSFYMFRLYFLVFSGKFRGTHEEEHHVHESPAAMTAVLWVLALGSIFVGFLGVPEVLLPESLSHYGNLFGTWLSGAGIMEQAHAEDAHEFGLLAGIATGVSALSIFIAWVLYGGGITERVRALVGAIEPLRKLVYNKYYVDEIYDFLIVRPIRAIAFVLWKVVDTFLIDGIVNLSAILVGFVGRIIKYVQNGDVQRYVVGVIAGAGIILFVGTNLTSCDAAHFKVDIDGQDVTVTAEGGGPTGARLKYRVMWEAGSEEKFSAPQDSTKFHHHYDLVGKKEITVEAIDPRWSTQRWNMAHHESQSVEVK